MDFSLTTEQRELVGEFHDFAARYFTRESVRQWQHDQGLPDEVGKAYAELYYRHKDLSGDNLKGGSLLSQALVNEEVSRVAGTSLPFANETQNLRIMREFAGSSSQLDTAYKTYRESGKLIFSLAVTEPNAGSDTMGMRTTVKTEDGKLVLNGRKTFVVNGEYAPYVMVAAIDGDAPEGKYPALSFWLVPLNLEGVRTYPISKLGQKILPFSDVVFDHVVVEESYRLSSAAKAGFPQLFHMLEVGRVLVCAQSLGLAQAAMDDAVEHARSRTAFGENIGSFQQIQEKLVDMEVTLRNMRYAVYHAAWSFDADEPDKRLAVALMKRYVPKAATQVADAALQVFGGRGYTDDERVSWIWQDCRGNQISEGTDEIMTYIAAPMILGDR